MTTPEESPLCFLCRDAVMGTDPDVFHCAEPACTCALHTPGCLQDYIRAHVVQKGGPLICPFEHVMPVRYRKHVHWQAPHSLGSCLWMIGTRLLLAALAYSDRGVYAFVALVAYVLSRVVGFYRLLPERPVSVRLSDLEMIAYVLGYLVASLIDTGRWFPFAVCLFMEVRLQTCVDTPHLVRLLTLTWLAYAGLWAVRDLLPRWILHIVVGTDLVLIPMARHVWKDFVRVDVSLVH